MKIKKDDTVKIILGKDRNKTGKVTHAFPKDEKIVVEGVNIRKKHTKPKKQGQKGQIVQTPMPIHVSKAMIICSSCGKAVRIKKEKAGKNKIRVCKKCKAEIK